MLFNTWSFAVFGLVVWAVYLVLGRRAQNVWLVAASYVFYGMWDWRFCGLLLLSTVVDYIVALRLESATSPHARRLLLGVSLCTNLGILGFFKYFNFFADSAIALLGQLGFAADAPTLHIILPVGISFYTFQTLSYSIDVYRRQAKPVRDPIVFALYVAYFPQLVAGPIERATQLLPQLVESRRVTAQHLSSGFLLILIGMVRKVAIADNMAPLADEIFAAPGDHTSLQLIAGVVLFSLQIYGDFAGYSDIARGTSRLLGIELMENFQQPYFSTNISQFWRRWHVSLSTWLRDYLYIPLGGNRGSTSMVYRNLMLTMLLGGLWHGAAWTFIAWGFIHGMALVIHKAWTDLAANWSGRLRQSLMPLGWALTMVVVLLAWIFFRAPDFTLAGEYLAGIFRMQTSLAGLKALTLPLLGGMLLLLFIDVPQAVTRNHTVLLTWPLWLRGIVYASLVLILVIFRSEADVPFIYFQF